jgi:hypothetical protein
MGEGQNVPAPTGGSFYSQICNFPEESFILSSPCNSVALRNIYKNTVQMEKMAAIENVADPKIIADGKIMANVKIMVDPKILADGGIPAAREKQAEGKILAGVEISAPGEIPPALGVLSLAQASQKFQEQCS